MGKVFGNIFGGDQGGQGGGAGVVVSSGKGVFGNIFTPKAAEYKKNYYAQDEDKKRQQAIEQAQKNIQEFNKSRKVLGSEKLGTLTSMVESFLGKSKVLPEFENAPRQYNAVRQTQQAQNEAQGPSNYLGRAGNFIENNIVPAVKEKASLIGDVMASLTDLAGGRSLRGGEENKFRARDDVETLANFGIGAGKNLAELGSGILKTGLEVNPISATGKLHEVYKHLQQAAGEKSIEPLMAQPKSGADKWMDKQGVLNYHPEYTNKYEKLGAGITELGTWLIPITRAGKAVKIEEGIAKAASEIPKIAKVIDAMPTLVKSGGRFFFEVGKDVADVAVLDKFRGKTWDETKGDLVGVAVGGVALRGTGKMAGRVLEKFGVISKDEQALINKIAESGGKSEETLATINKNKKYIVNVIGTADESATRAGKVITPEDFSFIQKDIQTAKNKIVKMEADLIIEDTIPKRYNFAEDWKAQFKNEFGESFTKEKATRFAEQSLKNGTGVYQDIFDTAKSSEKSLRRKIESESLKPEAKITFGPEKIDNAQLSRSSRRISRSILATTIRNELRSVGVVEKEATNLASKLKNEKNPEIIQGEIKKVIRQTPVPEVVGVGGSKTSKVARSIETKSVEKGLTRGFGEVAGYEPIVIKDQAERAAKVMSDDMAKAKRMVMGQEPMEKGLRGEMLIKAMEDHAQKTGDIALLKDLAKSPLVSETSAHAQAMRILAEREPDSAATKMRDIVKSRQANVSDKAKKKMVENIKTAVKEAPATKETWKSFIESIKCK